MNAIYKKLLQIIGSQQEAVLKTTLLQNSQISKELISETGHIHSADETECGLIRRVSESKRMHIEEQAGTHYLYEPYYPESRLIVLGGGHVSVPIVRYASDVGFSVTVVDDREEFANAYRFPSAKSVICNSYREAIEELEITKRDYVVIVTRGHRFDIDCLEWILPYQPHYLGMIGSKRKVLEVHEHLLDKGYSQETLDKLSAPIGFPIGAVSPEEIGISVLAEIICLKRNHSRELDPSGKMKNKSLVEEQDPELLNALAESNGTVGLVTVIRSSGSTPRAMGAKMLVYPSGEIVGTIGGGSIEAQSIRLAIAQMEQGGYVFHHVDMSGDVAEDKGMVCGGSMTVLIEILETEA